MTTDPRCSALAEAMRKQNVTYKQLADKLGESESRVTDICLGKQMATQEEFDKIAAALDIKKPIPHNNEHIPA